MAGLEEYKTGNYFLLTLHDRSFDELGPFFTSFTVNFSKENAEKKEEEGGRLNKLALFEEWLNRLLLVLGQRMQTIVQKFTPTKIKASSKKILHSKEHLRENFKKSKQLFAEKALTGIALAKSGVEKGKEKTAHLVVSAKETDWKNLSFKKAIIAFFTFISPPFLKLKNWYIGLKPASIATGVVISSVVSVTGVGIYQQTEKLAEKARGPASKEEVQIEVTRPKYYKLDEKALSVTNVVLPTYLESTGAIKKLVIDFTFITSNRYIKSYFWEHPHIINDRLNTKIEPIAVEFPLEDEGKDIIKDKIRREMNILLKELSIEGEIQQVYVDNITGA